VASVAAPSVESPLLLVALDDLGRAGGRSVRVLARVAAGTALAQKVPALVEREPDLLETATIVVGRAAVRLAAPELVFLGDELFDGYVNLRFVHPASISAGGGCGARRALDTESYGSVLIQVLDALENSHERA
jgi:hypothetical protein